MLEPSEHHDAVATNPTSPWRRIARHWGPFVVLGGLCLVAYGLDAYLKQSNTAGFKAPDARWHLVANDLPAFWTAVEALEAYTVLQETAPPFMAEGAVALRKLTGVRPTPSRLSLWLGKGAVLSGNGTDWSVSFRPGLALRTASWVHGCFAESSGTSGRLWGTISYGWRDGFLLLTSSSDFLAQLRETGVALAKDDGGRDGISLTWTGAQAGTASLFARDGLPVTLALEAPADDVEGPLHYADATTWPDAMVVVDSTSPDTTREFIAMGQSLAEPRVSEKTWSRWSALAEAWWGGQVPPGIPSDCHGESVWALFPPEASAEEGDFRFGNIKAACGPDYTGAVAALDNARAYRWDDREGWLVASAHHRASWSVAEENDLIAWTTDPQLLPHLLDATTTTSHTGTLYLRALWRPVIQLGKEQLLSLADQELIPEHNSDDIAEAWIPYLDGLAGWGRLELTSRLRNGTRFIEGHLAVLDPE